MNFQQPQLRLEDVNAATHRAKDQIKQFQVQLERWILDPDRDARRAAGACVVCYYGRGRVGGAAMTTANCRVCNVKMQFGSTAVDGLCQSCARRLNLCKQCGSDRELLLRRRLDTKSIEKVAPFPVTSRTCDVDEGAGPCALGRCHLGPHDPEGTARPVLLPLRKP